jgi:2',3'-cyclic-nucleotide 2'-phosphodiesterase (5'-nucleotidase family)
LIDYEPGKPVKILHYQLIPVYTTDPQDPQIASEVVAARQDLENIYGHDWLNEVLTVSDVPMEIPTDHPTVWGNMYIDALRETAGADAGLDSTEFFGGNTAAGPVTRESLMNFYPRYFDLTKKLGWTVWTVAVPGWMLKIVLEITTKDGLFFNLSQIDYDVITGDGAPKVKNIQVDGKPLNLFKTYHVAVSEGIGRGLGGVSIFLKLLFHPKDTGIPIWIAVENHIRNLNQPQLSMKNVTPHRLPASVKWTPARMDALIQ